MKFKEMVYTRPDMEKYASRMRELFKSFREASEVEKQISLWEEVNALRKEVSTMHTLVSIRNSINSNDEFYEKERDFWISVTGELSQLEDEFRKIILESKFREELSEKFGSLVFAMFEQANKTFSPDIIEELVLENKLSEEVDKLRANAKVIFRGQEYTLSHMVKFTTSTDVDERYEAIKTVTKFYEDNSSEFDRLYDELVKTRTRMAKKLGYENYVRLAYDRLGRLDYGPQEVAAYREQIKKHIVPLASKLINRQAKRNGKEKMKFLDESIVFRSGNPSPKGSQEELLQAAKKMYKSMSIETDQFFTMMYDNGLLDLESKHGKRPGGYCTFIEAYESPFIFANFNGTSHDVDVLTHEAGHAFQIYSSRKNILPEYLWPTFEACEIHSMSMEFFAWPYMESFFKEDTAKYYFDHLAKAILFLPYGALVDHFQEEVYKNPELTPSQRLELWRELETQYLPSRDYEGLDFLAKGSYWYRQGHIFSTPFYYIDYTLAQVCALQYCGCDRKNHQEAWASYLDLCKLGGSKTFLNLIEEASLLNPFASETIPHVLKEVEAYLDSVDDSKF